jgi:quinol monooxygenase YgiN
VHGIPHARIPTGGLRLPGAPGARYVAEHVEDLSHRKLTAADGRADDLETALRGVIDAAAEEDGLEVYSAHAVADEPGVYYFFELYRDQAAIDVHGKGERMRAAMGAVGGLLAGRPELTMMSPVAAKGLDL